MYRKQVQQYVFWVKSIYRHQKKNISHLLPPRYISTYFKKGCWILFGCLFYVFAVYHMGAMFIFENKKHSDSVNSQLKSLQFNEYQKIALKLPSFYCFKVYTSICMCRFSSSTVRQCVWTWSVRACFAYDVKLISGLLIICLYLKNYI